MATGKAKTAMDEVDADGNFQRTDALFRNWIEKGGEFPPAKDRYILYISWACPWASRCMAVRALLGLQEVIKAFPVEAVMQRTRPDDPNDEHIGWWFSESRPEPVYGCKTIRELYEKHDEKGTTTKFSVPVLFDTEKKKIVSNESSEIIRMLKEFEEFADPKAPFFGVDLYPKELQKEIDEMNDLVYNPINNGVYRCGFSTKQSAYEKAAKELIEHMEKVEDILSKQRYLVGDSFTEADVRLAMTLFRFTEIYTCHFKCIVRLEDFPNMLGFTRELFQMDGVKETVDIADAKTHYYKSHAKQNSYGIIPISPYERPGSQTFPQCYYNFMMQPHGRDK